MFCSCGSHELEPNRRRFCYSLLAFLSFCCPPTISHHPWCFSSVFLSLTKLRSSLNQNTPSIRILQGMFGFKMIDRSISQLGMSFQDLRLTTLLLNNHSYLKVQETLGILDMFGLKITFSMKIVFHLFFNVYLLFDLILYVYIYKIL
jgi:hypothetical protein